MGLLIVVSWLKWHSWDYLIILVLFAYLILCDWNCSKIQDDSWEVSLSHLANRSYGSQKFNELLAYGLFMWLISIGILQLLVINDHCLDLLLSEWAWVQTVPSLTETDKIHWLPENSKSSYVHQHYSLLLIRIPYSAISSFSTLSYYSAFDFSCWSLFHLICWNRHLTIAKSCHHSSYGFSLFCWSWNLSCETLKTYHLATLARPIRGSVQQDALVCHPEIQTTKIFQKRAIDCIRINHRLYHSSLSHSVDDPDTLPTPDYLFICSPCDKELLGPIWLLYGLLLSFLWNWHYWIASYHLCRLFVADPACQPSLTLCLWHIISE